MTGPSALYATDRMREIEARAQALPGIDEGELMRRAGQAAWRCLLRHWPEAQRIVVLCGPGNNGGDGWVLARHAQESGRRVQVLYPPSLPPASPLAQRMAAEYRASGGAASAFDGRLPAADVIVDALFGLGLARAPQGEVAAMIKAANTAPAAVLAIDLPSGVDGERGSVPGVAIHASHSVQFIAAHPGLVTGAGVDHAGALSLATLDLPASVFADVPPLAEVQARPRLPARRRDSHKGRFGHLLVVGGDAGMGGALVLAAEAALRSGCGVLTAATRAAHVPVVLARRPEAMVQAVEDADGLSALLAPADALVLGPGLGRSAWSQALFAVAIDWPQPRVIDADALNLLAEAPRACPSAVLTPHPGEAARLLGCDVASVQADRWAAAHALAERYACAVVLKGAGSLIAAPGERTRVVTLGNPGMASAGMGDALAGVIGARLAQGDAPFVAACHGAWLHARAGDLAAGDGEAGMLASDLIARLRQASRECTLDA
ncbi:NAD(P)H-hydrate dehydratase [Luteimonas sp. e5]